MERETGSLDRQYEAACIDLDDLGKVTENLLRELLRTAGLRIHSVTHRLKAKSSVQRKMASEGSGYSAVTDLQDLLGLRVITFFPDEVDEVAKVIEREFAIDWDGSVDKRKLLDPDRFGYMSLHYIASLSPSRSALTEHRRFADRLFEIQVRSILQHAWAEIEHDLGYHSPAAIPLSIRRRFSRLSGLLEIADDEFQRLRDDSAEHQHSVDADIATAPESLPLDRDSVSALIRTNETVRALDEHIARYFVTVGSDDEYVAGPRAKELQALGFESIGEVAEALRTKAELIKRFTDILFTEVEYFTNRALKLEMPRGICLFYLGYVTIAETGSRKAVEQYLEAQNISMSPNTVERLLSAYREAFS